MWTKTKKRLNSFICDSLKDRVDFHCSNYRMHDGIGRTYITVDDDEVFNMCTLKSNYYGRKNEDDYSQVEFMEVLEAYFDSSINDILASEHELMIILSLLDRRVGKRTLIKLLDKYKGGEETIRYFLELRCEAEGISYKENVIEL